MGKIITVDFSQHIAETIAANTEIILLEKRASVKELVAQSEESENLPQISTYVLHCMRTGKSFPGVDKLFILGELLNVDPRSFIQPRTPEEVDGFLQLDFKEKYIRASLLARTGNNKKVNR